MSGSVALDLAAMETEAKAKARKQVANLLQRPEQLEKTEQIRKRVARKKATVEAMLKTAVQSQLDGVRTGLNQLQTSLEDIRDIRAALKDVDDAYRAIDDVGDKLAQVRDENSRHSQLAAAVENLKHIFNVPELVKKTGEHLVEGRLLAAHKALAELETARDDLLAELHKQATPSPTDRHTVMNYFGAVEKLSEDLGKQLWMTFQRAMLTVRREPTHVVTVLRIVEREERLDEMLLKNQTQTGFIPPGRPKRWRAKAFEELEKAVTAKVEANQMEDRAMDKMWLVRHLERTRQLVIEDLTVVKNLFPAVFPPHYDIARTFTGLYHTALAARLRDIIEQGLEGNEIVTLLTWVGAYRTEELMDHPDLRLDTTYLGPLLEEAEVATLQQQYLATLRANFREWMSNSLRSEVKDWYRDQEPDSDEKGYFNTSMPVILFQMIEQNLTVAATINKTLLQSVLNMSVEELQSFARTYNEELHHFKEKHKVSRLEPQFFLQYMIASVNNCSTFREQMGHIEHKYGAASTSDGGTAGGGEVFSKCSKIFLDIAEKVLSYILDEVFMDLETHMKELFTHTWLQSSNACDTICITIEDYCQDFVHLRDNEYERVLNRSRDRIVYEYLRALMAKKISFRSYEERLPAAEKMTAESEQLRALFDKLASRPQVDSPFEAFPMLSEVIKMRDTSMMTLELSGIVARYPHARPEHLINLLLTRGDVTRVEARQMVCDAIGEEGMNNMSRPSGFFTQVPAP